MLDKETPPSTELSRFPVYSEWQWAQQEQARAKAAVAELLAYQQAGSTQTGT
jgi:hypothetical protein